MSQQPGMQHQVASMSLDLATQLSRLSAQAQALHEASKRAAASSRQPQHADAGVQVDTTSRFPVQRSFTAGALSQPFSYQPFDRRVNWKRIRQLDTAAMAAAGSTAELPDLLDMVSRADLSGDSSYNLTEGNLLQLLRVSQMLLQCMRYKLEQGQAASSAAEEQQAELALQLAALPDLGLAELGSGLGQLQQGFDALAQLEALLGAGAGAGAGGR